MPFYLGLDFGTSGARAIAIDEDKIPCWEGRVDFTICSHTTTMWREALFALLAQIPQAMRREMRAIAIDGTSSTVLLCDDRGEAIAEPLLYNDARGGEVEEEICAISPPDSVVRSATSSLAKLLWWEKYGFCDRAAYFLHQADWLGFQLHGQLGISDYHNGLKLGYDVERLCYPDWLTQLSLQRLYPRIVAPGTPVGEMQPHLCDRFDFPRDCVICAGTTDSIAAFLASGATQPGEGVTSLGSTLVLKLLSATRVEEARSGIYSHRLGDLWLAGGASNTGGAVLRHFFGDEELQRLSSQIEGDRESPLQYYPLLTVGERFPISDSHLAPQLEPRPENPVAFLHGLLEGIARIEGMGYQRLQDLGATALKRVYTAGGGAKNPQWETIRHRHLRVPMAASQCLEAAFGTALLAQGFPLP
ncbi:FGGY-family carbohydrate kinase [Spirulina sp. 06S082]|uniref:FGGY-family carbohydrate kinase n=1 Tax=Spirulina sp. 06S082 TaxID=3110248 RepID=UPI002B20D050|nr:FGGY-family carbohydrate kinase [Spirulina sp. 06S082]MEA5470898.1 FGGY-family carbohydrate kinase [Spirulina sp. 06S082]